MAGSSVVSVPSLDGRTFVGVSNTADGEVGTATTFDYHERDGLVWAEYAGGGIRLGRLTGTRSGDLLDFRYVHVSADGSTSSGHCAARLELLPDGRVRSHETWVWESRPGSGASVVEEPRP
jgi:hypothetical protein